MEAQKDAPEIEGPRITVVAEGRVTAGGKDWEKRFLRLEARTEWWLACGSTKRKARLSSPQGPSRAGPSGPYREV